MRDQPRRLGEPHGRRSSAAPESSRPNVPLTSAHAPEGATHGLRPGTFQLAVACTLALAPLVAGCAASSPSPLHPASARADELRWLWWALFVIAGVIFLAVVAILGWGMFRQPSADEQDEDRPLGTRLVWFGGILIPGIVLLLTYGISVALMRTSSATTDPLTIEVIGHQWWWEVRYPQSDITTANEIHIPVSQPTRILVTSADVIHGFWVPELQGKIDGIPGQTNAITLDASRSGVYRGVCTVYCAEQHANMRLLVVAEPSDQFSSWLSNQRATQATPSDPQLLRGQEIFLSSACASCHSLAGTDATGQAGPDLTHLASRQEIGAGVLPNTAAALSAWISNPQTAKPGALMPPESFSGPDLQALVAYLDSLK